MYALISPFPATSRIPGCCSVTGVLVPPSHLCSHAVSDGGMPEMDEEVIQKADTCTKMMWCLTIHDLEDIRGRLIACDFLGDHGLYATDGIGLTGLIDTPTGALTVCLCTSTL